MTEIQRVRKVADWLLFKGYAQNDRELAQKLGYSRSFFSQVMNEKAPLSVRFVQLLCSVNKNINYDWVLTGAGDMLKGAYSDEELHSTAAEPGLPYGHRHSGGQPSGGTLTNEFEMRALIEMLQEKDRQMAIMQSQISELINKIRR